MLMRITSDSDDPLVVEKTKLNIQLATKGRKQTKLGGAMIVESVQDLLLELPQRPSRLSHSTNL